MHAHMYTRDNVKGQIWNKPPDTIAVRLLSSCQVCHFILGSIPSAKGPGLPYASLPVGTLSSLVSPARLEVLGQTGPFRNRQDP